MRFFFCAHFLFFVSSKALAKGDDAMQAVSFAMQAVSFLPFKNPCRIRDTNKQVLDFNKQVLQGAYCSLVLRSKTTTPIENFKRA